MTVEVTVHEKRSNLRQKGAGSGLLTRELRARFRMIYRQEGIVDSDMEGMAEFKFKSYHKIPWGSCGMTIGCFGFELA